MFIPPIRQRVKPLHLILVELEIKDVFVVVDAGGGVGFGEGDVPKRQDVMYPYNTPTTQSATVTELKCLL